ncbi:MAG: nickel pincer cofactor biosynthesis protein LarC [Anaerolineae bacterium]|nr:nickel pincer cofactor biosynthesis protein LarC [Anaerolineae bacterium]
MSHTHEHGHDHSHDHHHYEPVSNEQPERHPHAHRLLYVDAFAGASGDMLLGALIDAGLELDALKAELGKLNLEGYDLHAEHITSHGLTGARLHVHDTLEAYPARHLHDIYHLIYDSALSDPVKRSSMAVIERLGRAEASIHGIPLEEVHFHEIGAVDTIVDVVGFVAGLELMGIDQVYASAIPLGSGTVDIAHGRFPAPAPATLALLAAVNAPTVPHPATTEIVTPTGAALLSQLALFERPPMRVQRIGYGFGTKEFPWANAIRVWLGERVHAREHARVHGHHTEHDEVIEMECNLDDTTGETLGYTMERLFEAGALDVWFTSIQMKKNRPGVLLSILAAPDKADLLAEIALRETSTLGVRTFPPSHRLKADRRMAQVETPWGAVRVKEKWLDGQRIAASPEYEDCARLARQSGEPIARIMNAAVQAAG